MESNYDQEHSVGRRLGRIHKLVRSRMHQTWEGLGLYRGQNEVLFVLWREEGLTQSELAMRTLVAPATMTNTLQRMERDGWVSRRPDPDDQRISRVYLTEQGRTLRQPVRDAMESLEQDMLSGFSASEREIFAGYLERVIGNLQTKQESS